MLESKLLTGLLLMISVFVVAFDGIKSENVEKEPDYIAKARVALRAIEVLRCLERTPIGKTPEHKYLFEQTGAMAIAEKPDEQLMEEYARQIDILETTSLRAEANNKHVKNCLELLPGEKIWEVLRGIIGL